MNSGFQDFSSDGKGLSGLLSGHSVVNSIEKTIVGQIIKTGNNELTASGLIDDVMSSGYSQCDKVNYTTGIVGNLIETRSATGIMYGYC